MHGQHGVHAHECVVPSALACALPCPALHDHGMHHGVHALGHSLRRMRVTYLLESFVMSHTLCCLLPLWLRVHVWRRAFSYIAPNGYTWLTCSGTGGCFLKSRLSFSAGTMQDYSTYTSGALMPNGTGEASGASCAAGPSCCLAAPGHWLRLPGSQLQQACGCFAPPPPTHTSCLALLLTHAACCTTWHAGAVASYLDPGMDYDVDGSPIAGMPPSGACPMSTATQQECALRCASIAACVGYVYSSMAPPAGSNGSTATPPTTTTATYAPPAPAPAPAPSASYCPGGCRLQSAWGPGLYRGPGSGYVAMLMSPVAYATWQGYYFYGGALPGYPESCGGAGAGSVDACAQHCKSTAGCR